MFIQTETTPNPATMKFLPGQDVMPAGTANFPDRDSASASPLAEELFLVEGVKGVFFGTDFVTVTKSQDTDWNHLKPHILMSIMEHFVSGKPLFYGEGKETPASSINEDDSDLVKQIKELIDTRVRPAVAQDGGDIIFRGFEDGIVTLELHGSCSG
ncbi:MAG: NifU family protein, partial [Rectinemataceae bacterium]|nr:NifU family protein [Rectinemataceae bacterium]